MARPMFTPEELEETATGLRPSQWQCGGGRELR